MSLNTTPNNNKGQSASRRGGDSKKRGCLLLLIKISMRGVVWLENFARRKLTGEVQLGESVMGNLTAVA